ncbi:MAG: HAD family hydrolase [Promethearchaeota archaeon]
MNKISESNNLIKKKNNNATVDVVPIILFDVDGTLVRGSTLHIRAFIYAIRKVYGVVSRINWKKVAGKTDLWILHDILEDHGVSDEIYRKKLDEFLKEIVFFYKEHIEEENNVYLLPGVKQLIAEIKEKAYLGLVTGNIEQIARMKVKKAGLDYNFEFGGFGDENWDRSIFMRNAVKKAIKLYNLNSRSAFENAYYVADTPHDVEAARKANIKCIIVLTGFYKKTKFKRLEPDLFLDGLESKEDRLLLKQFIGII